MPLHIQISDFRKRLEEILNVDVGQSSHAEALRDLQGEYKHSIILLEEIPAGTPSASAYNCYAYALGLVNVEIVFTVSSCYREVFPGDEFIRSLLAEGVLEEISERDVRDGDYVIYFDAGGTPQHAGEIASGRVRSKMGGWGHLWEHALAEVPANYGETVRFYSEVLQQVAIEAFIRFARAKGVDSNILPDQV